MMDAFIDSGKVLGGYPPLQVQWRRQCDIVKKDERLQRLIGRMDPPSYPPPKLFRGRQKKEDVTKV